MQWICTMAANKYKKLTIVITFLSSSNLCLAADKVPDANRHMLHNVAISGGAGSPSSMHGYRISAATEVKSWKCIHLDVEASYAKWINNRPDINNLDIFSLGPMLRIEPYQGEKFTPFLQASIAAAKKSSIVVGYSESGSKWTFQDIVGLGIKYHDKFSLSFSYLHYSNGSLAKPNPGIDILPLVTLRFLF